ncbi:hypothetical protein C8R47DRAFT_1322993 [Mycena vitilis]|nr:hypothetical protein C8R47DRAFT_1322993 [Mycena vitilis]
MSRSTPAMPATRSLHSPLPVWDRRPRSPLYGLGWRSSEEKILERLDTCMTLAEIPRHILRRKWLDLHEGKFPDIIFNPTFSEDMSAPANEPNRLICYITFNVTQKALDALEEPDGKTFIHEAKKLLHISKDEENSLMWYKCRPSDY